jgi:ligand-binding sensor domain-containing protein
MFTSSLVYRVSGMYNKLLQYFFNVLVLTCVLPVNAQVAYHNFNSSSGLPSNETYCVVQDKKGYIWFGTDHGVVKYNGYNFRTYTTADGLTDNTVFRIKEDGEGRLWFMTLSGGICYLEGNSFFPHPNNDTIKYVIGKHLPTSWAVRNDKSIWLGLVDFGIYHIGNSYMYEFVNRDKILASDSTYFCLVKFSDSDYVYTSSDFKKIDAPVSGDIVSIDTFSIGLYDMPYSNMNFSLVNTSQLGVLLVGGKTLFT